MRSIINVLIQLYGDINLRKPKIYSCVKEKTKPNSPRTILFILKYDSYSKHKISKCMSVCMYILVNTGDCVCTEHSGMYLINLSILLWHSGTISDTWFTIIE